MRICTVISVPMPPQEGIGYYAWYLARYLMGEGHAVQIVTRGERGKPAHEVLDGIPIWRPTFYPLYPFHVHLHGLFVQRLVQRLEDEVDVFHLHTPLPPPLRTRQPQLITAHTTQKTQSKAIPIESLRSLLIRAQVPVSARVEHRLFDHATRIAVYARSVAQELGEYDVDRQKVEMVGSGVDTDLFRPRELSQEAPPAEEYVFAAARLELRKGLEDLIDAMSHVARQFPGVYLYIAGMGPLGERLRARAERLGLGDTVRFLGHVATPQLLALYQGATVFAHPAHYEGLPTVLIQAMACGKAVVCTAVSGALDVVEDDVNGLFVPPHAPEQLAGAICRLLGDAGLRARLGVAARRTIEDRFSWQTVGAGYVRCYQALLKGDGR